VLINANRVGQSFAIGDFAGRRFFLHPALRGSHDPLVRTASYDRGSGAFTVPARTAAVFWTLRPLRRRIELLRADVDGLAGRGLLGAGQGSPLAAKLEAALGQLDRGRNDAAVNQLRAFANQARALVMSGALSPEDGAALAGEAESVVEQAGGAS